MVTDDQGATASAIERFPVSCPRQDLAPWVAADIGSPPWSGSAWFDGEGLQVCAAGTGFASRSDEGFFLYQEVGGDFRITARVARIGPGSASRRAGVMIRDSLDPGARVVTALAQPSTVSDENRARVRYRGVSGGSMSGLTLTPAVEGAEIRVRIERRGLDKIIASASSDGATWSSVDVPFDPPLPPTVFVGIAATHGTVSTTGSDEAVRATLTVDLDTSPPGSFRRGDANGDGKMNISDPVFILMHILSDGSAPACRKTADVNDNGEIELGDPIFALNYLFASGPAPPAPLAECGADPTDDGLSCEGYPPCE